jgi:hypothetical protein
MQHKRSNGARRPAGTGSLFTRTDAAGRESWYGKLRVGGRQVKRKLGAKARARRGRWADQAAGRGGASTAGRRDPRCASAG